MATACVAKPVHPALYTGVSTTTTTTTTPPTPTSAVSSPARSMAAATTAATPARAVAPPQVNYALLRAHHAAALRYQIGKLRWEQANNGYLRGEDAWMKSNYVVGVLENELGMVECARAALDRWPHVPAPTWAHAPHGPPTRAEHEAALAAEAARLAAANRRLDAQFPWLRQLFIGPLTKQQARNDRLLREQLEDGIYDDIEVLLPSENMDMLIHGKKRKDKERGGGGGGKKMTYDELRVEREKNKIAAMAREAGVELATGAKQKGAAREIGPLTREEAEAEAKAAASATATAAKNPATHGPALPRASRSKDDEANLQAQREQRRLLLNWLRQPWGKFNERAADGIEYLARIALRELELEARASKRAVAGETADAGEGDGGQAAEKKGARKAKESEHGKEAHTHDAGVGATKGASKAGLEGEDDAACKPHVGDGVAT